MPALAARGQDTTDAPDAPSPPTTADAPLTGDDAASRAKSGEKLDRVEITGRRD